MLNQSNRCESWAADLLSGVGVIGWLSPVWITLKLAVNDRHAGGLASGLTDHLVQISADRVGVARRKVGVVGVQTLHAARRSPDAPARTMLRATGERYIFDV
jgi:hypothetical protein